MPEIWESKGGHHLLMVQWIDSRRSGGTIYTPEELRDFASAKILTIGFGYVLKDRVVLATEFYPESLSQSEQYRDIYNIPKVCIEKIIYLMDKK